MDFSRYSVCLLRLFVAAGCPNLTLPANARHIERHREDVVVVRCLNVDASMHLRCTDGQWENLDSLGNCGDTSKISPLFNFFQRYYEKLNYYCQSCESCANVVHYYSSLPMGPH